MTKKASQRVMNIQDELNALGAATNALAQSDVAIAEAEDLLDKNLGELEAMEPSVDSDIDKIERDGQEAITADMIESAETLDALESEQKELEEEDARESVEEDER